MGDKKFKFGKEKVILKCNKKIANASDKAFEYYCPAVKKDAYSMSSKFYSITEYYPETEADTETYYTQITADLYAGKELIDNLRLSDEFDTAKEAEKWVFEVFQTLFLDILDQT